MPRYKLDRLARDKMIAWMEQRGFYVESTTISGQAYHNALSAKLVEEADEVAQAQSKQEIIEELADVQEVLNALYKAHDISPEQVEAYRQQKHAERGGFEGGLFFTTVYIEPNSPAQKYFDEHPEIELIEE